MPRSIPISSSTVFICPPPLGTELRVKFFAGAVVEAPHTLGGVAVVTEPSSVVFDVALERVDGGATDNLSSCKITSPMSKCHSSYLLIMYSEFRASPPPL